MPSGLNVAADTGAPWPSSVSTSLPVFASQMRAVPSAPAVTAPVGGGPITIGVRGTDGNLWATSSESAGVGSLRPWTHSPGPGVVLGKPAAVQTAIKDKAGSNEIVKIEKKTEEGKTVYEAVVNKKGKEWSIEVDANGKFLKQYEESKEKEEKGEKY